MGPLKSYFLLVAFHLIFSFIFIIIFKTLFAYPTLLIPLHVTLVAVLIVGTTLFLGFLISFRGFREWRVARYILSLIPAIGFALLILLYLTDSLSNSMWGGNVTLKFIVAYMPRLKVIAETLPFTAGWIYFLLAGLAVFILAIYMGLSKQLFRALEELFLPQREFSMFRDHSRALKSFVIIGLLVLGFIGFMFQYFNEVHARRWKGEPIASLFVHWSDFRTDPHRLAVSQEDRLIRTQYHPELPFEKKNIVIIMVDSLRADHMQIYGYKRPTTPFLASLLETGKLKKVKFAFSTCSESLCGILSTMASRNYRSLSCTNFKLYDLLRDQGYKVYFILSDDHTAWSDLNLAYGSNIDFYYDGDSTDQYSHSDDRLLLEGLKCIPDYTGTPAFFFVFLMSAHFTGVKHETFDRYRPSKLHVDFGSFLKGEFDSVVLTNRYDNGIIQADAFIQEIFAALDRKDYLDNSLVVILADHGDGLGERGNYAHTEHLYQEDIGIPILIYDDPEVRYANLEFATQIDVAPTILDRLGLPIPSSWQGRSLLETNIKHHSYHQTRRNNPCRALIYRTDGAIFKYIHRGAEDTASKKDQLYELVSDPGEQLDLMPTADVRLIQHMKEEMSEGFGIPVD